MLGGEKNGNGNEQTVHCTEKSVNGNEGDGIKSVVLQMSGKKRDTIKSAVLQEEWQNLGDSATPRRMAMARQCCRRVEGAWGELGLCPGVFWMEH